MGNFGSDCVYVSVLQYNPVPISLDINFITFSVVETPLL